jgi:type I restriction enzyme M protein
MKVYNNSEMDIVVKNIAPFLHQLGFHDDEILYNYPVPVGRGKTIYADIVIKIDDVALLVIEAKRPNENLRYFSPQAESYGLLLRSAYYALTDGHDIIIFSTANSTEKYSGHLNITKLNFLNRNKLSNLITKTVIVYDEDKIENAKKTAIIFEDIKNFSDILYDCQDIIRDNDGLTGSDAFDEIAKILFVKIFYEKKELAGKRNELKLLELKDRDNLQGYFNTPLFQNVKNDNPDIFSNNETIKLSSETLLKLVEKLDNYTLLSTDIDVKGRTFEIFLGRTLTGDLGQFFTPRTVVRFMVDFCSTYLNMFDNENMCKIIDTSCGSGGFLIEVFKYLYSKHRQDVLYTDKLKKEAIYGIDVNPRLAQVAKMNMILHGDGHSGIQQGNGLIDIDDIAHYDLVITNPPFGNKDSGEILQMFDLGKIKFKEKDLQEKSTKPKKEKQQYREILFVEKCIKITKWGGGLLLSYLMVS